MAALYLEPLFCNTAALRISLPPLIVLTGNIFSVMPNPLVKQIAYKPIPINNLLSIIENILYPVGQEVPVPDQSAYIQRN